MMRKPILLIFLIFVIQLYRCTPNIAGGGTEDVNTKIVTGKVFNQNNTPASDAIVMLIPAGYNPVFNDNSKILTDTTDTFGSYSFKLKESGNFSVQFFKTSDKTRALLTNEPVTDDTTIFPQANLSVPGTIHVYFPESTFLSKGYVYIPGTTISAPVTQPGQVIQLDSVPSGLIPSLCFTSYNSTSKIIRDSISVVSEKISTVNFASWTHTSQVTLNTSASGADISSDIIDFPVLIRLNSTNFNFDQAMENGADIRFTKKNGEILPYEIELWKKDEKRAAIWVNVDTIYGGNDSQYVLMYWGNSVATSKSSNSQVFDTSSGFLAAWHLGSDVDSNITDASAYHFNGTNYGTAGAEGIIGDAREFSPGSYIKVPGLLTISPSLTLSAWINSDTINKVPGIFWGMEIVSIGDHALLRLDDYYGIGTCGWYYRSPVTDTGFSYASSGKYLSNTGWHLITYTIDTEAHIQTLYIDGVSMAVTNDVNPISYSGLGSDTYIGIHGNGEKIYNFAGLIDEVRVLRTVQSADAVKLAFMNQKKIDLLVTFK
jgi:hypothetical protein